MDTNNPTTKPAVVDVCQSRLTAIQTHAAHEEQILIDGHPYKPADLVAIYQASIDTRRGLTSARGAVAVAMQDRKNADAKRVAVDQGLKSWVSAKFGARSQELHDFGYRPRKAAKKTTEVKVAAVEQARATRAARHTMGKNHKEKVRGNAKSAQPTNGAPAKASA